MGLESHLQGQLDASFAGFFWHRLRFGAVLPFIPRKENVRVLDIGAGTGVFGRLLRKARPDIAYYFSEPIPAMSAVLEKEFGLDRNAVSMDWGDMDAALLLDVLEHQQDDGRFLRETADRLRPGARLLVTVPAHPWLWSSWDRGLGHFRRYSRPMLRRLTADCGLVDLRTRNICALCVLPGLVRKWTLDSDHTEFPVLRPWQNRLIYRAGRLFDIMKCGLPVGSTLFTAMESPRRERGPGA